MFRRVALALPPTMSLFPVMDRTRLIKSPSVVITFPIFRKSFLSLSRFITQPANLFFTSIVGIDKKSKMKRRASRAERRAFLSTSPFYSLNAVLSGGLDGRYPWGHVVSYLIDRDDGRRFRCVLSLTGSLSGGGVVLVRAGYCFVLIARSWFVVT